MYNNECQCAALTCSILLCPLCTESGRLMLLLSNKYMPHQEEAWWSLWIINQDDYNDECAQIYLAI